MGMMTAERWPSGSGMREEVSIKAVLQNVKTGDVTVDEISPPVLKPGNVLVRNACSLVSAGTEKAVMDFSSASYLKKAQMRPDLFRKVLNKAKNDGFLATYKVVSRLIEQKIALGYSTAGVVAEVGREISDLQVGQRVACAGLFAATHSEVVSVPRNLVAPIPDGVPDEEACFVTLGAIAMQGVRLADLALSENVLVYGLGLVGMIAAQLAAAAGCRVIGVDVDARKLQLARELGIEAVAADENTESAVLGFAGGYGADKVLLCAATKSNEPIERVPAMMRQKGVLVVVGDVSLNIPRRAYFEKEIDIRISRSYGPGRYDMSYEEGGLDYPYGYVRWTENRNMVATLDLLARKRLDFSRLISHRFDIDGAVQAYDIISGKVKADYLGIVIRYPGDPAAPVSKTVRLAASPGDARGDLRIGMIGAGNFGKAFLLPAFSRQPGARFVGICTASGVSAAAMAKEYRMEFATSDAEEIFGRPDVNALVVATRHDSHAKYVLRGLESDKAVFVEKPLCTTVEDLEAIRKLYEEKIAQGRKPFLMVGFNRRFSPLAAVLRNAFASKKTPLSVIYRVNAGSVPPTEWVKDPMQGAGRVVGEVCHFVDFITFLVGYSPAGLTAAAVKQGGRPVDDVLTLTLDYPDGSIGTIHYFANGDTGMAKEYVEVFGGKACAQLLNFRQLRVSGVKAAGKTSYFNQVKGYEEESAAFVSAVRSGDQPPIPFEDLCTTTRATLLVGQALSAGQRVEIRCEAVPS